MKQVTIENVKKRILELERAGYQGLSISLNEDRELDCLRQLVAVTEQLHAVVAENAALKEACGGDGSYRNCPACTHSEYIEAPETPATDAAIAALRAEGAEIIKNRLEQELSKCYQDEQVGLVSAVEIACDVAALLRQSVQVKGVQS
ncbi:TPA: hypothetical protein ACQ431_002970 [Citrobacter murliniae]